MRDRTEKIREHNREHKLPLLIGKEVLVKDRHTSGSGYLSVSEEVAGYTGAVYYVRGRNFSGKFQLANVSWVEEGTIWLR